MAVAAIFDFDGLLADTERLHRAAYVRAAARHGIALTEAEYADHWIRRGLGIADFLAERGWTADVAAIRRDKADEYHRLLGTDLHPMPGARALLDRLHGRIRMAVATSSYPRDARAALRALGFASCFECVATSDDVERLKPAPDLFLHAARTLGVPPAQCVVLEDAEKGVLAARAAGMPCIAVPNEFTRGNDFSAATAVVDSLDAVTEEMIRGR
jgi:HAD superfamily hydrolase (TIGR01509 family)